VEHPVADGCPRRVCPPRLPGSVAVRAEINIGERASIRLRCTLRRVARGSASAEALHCTARMVVIADEPERGCRPPVSSPRREREWVRAPSGRRAKGVTGRM